MSRCLVDPSSPARYRAVLRLMVIGLFLVTAWPTIATAEEEGLAVAVERGLAGLVRIQQDNGSIDSGARVTSLAGMAFLSGGHTPTRGRYYEASARCLRHVLGQQDPLTGYLGTNTHYGMYEHGFATLYLAEVYGMTADRRVRRALEAALDLIFRAQNSEGGWRYSPVPVDADISVTICQVMAIRAAHNVGVGGDRAQQVQQRAVDYVRSCAKPDGSFTYMANGRGSWGTEGAEGVPRAAAGSMCLIGAGITDAGDPVLGPAIGFLRKHVEAHLRGQGSWYWYGQYYAAQAMFHSPEAADWQRYWRLARPTIVERQGPDGLWTGPDSSYGAGFNTAMALIILQIPNNYLPIFQR